MNTITYLQNTFININNIFHSTVGDLTEEEWVARSTSEQNMLGFIAWHIPRTQDTHVQTWIRGIPEVVRAERWDQWRHLKSQGNGVGISLAEADSVACSIQRADVLDYANAVHHEILIWLEDIDDSELDNFPNYSLHLSAYPEYQTQGYLEESSDLFEQPVWAQLMRPCIGHIHRHLGELEAAKNILRAVR